MQVSDSLWLNRSFKQEYLQKIVDTPLRDKRYRYSCVAVSYTHLDVYKRQPFAWCPPILYRPANPENNCLSCTPAIRTAV